MSLKEKILEQMDFRDFYRDQFPEWSGEGNISCPFADERHESGQDSSPSFSLSSEGQAFCHGCGYKATSPIGLLVDLEKKSFKRVCRELYAEYVEPLVPPSYVKKGKIGLAKNEFAIARLDATRGISKKIIKQYDLGWDGRLVIPIRNEHGYTVNLRRYDLMGRFKAKIVSYGKKEDPAKYGKARLWPLSSLKKKEIWLFEGEMDTLAALSLGINAITITIGAKVWKDEWNEAFKGKDIFIVPDVDKVGMSGAKKKLDNLKGIASSVSLVLLPLEGSKKEKDFTDWLMKTKGTKDGLRKLVKAKVNTKTSLPKQNGSSVMLDAFEHMTQTEELHIGRATAALDYMLDNGSFFRNQNGELFYAQKTGKAFKISAKDDRFLAFLSRISSVINSATSSGRFIIQHIVNQARIQSGKSTSGSWGMFHKNSIYLYATDGKIMKVSEGGKTETMQNAINEESILLESPPSNKSFTVITNQKPAEAVDLFWDLILKNIPISSVDRYMLGSHLLGVFFKEYVRPKPLVRLIARTAYGKSTTSKMISLLLYGEEILNHSASTLAATYAMAQKYPYLIFDNIETRNMTPSMEDFLLIAATGGMKTKRQMSTDQGIIMEATNCLVLTNGIEPLTKHELTNRTLEIELDIAKYGVSHFHETQIFHNIKKNRSKLLCGLNQLLMKYALPRVRKGHVQRIAREFGMHSKTRFNEYLGLMSVILDSIWPFHPLPGYPTPHKVVEAWLDSQTSATKKQDEGTNDVLYFFNTLADRRDRLLDAETKVKIDDDGDISMKSTTRDLLSDFRLLARHLGIKCPWQSERHLGTRIVDAEHILNKAGWKRIKKIISGKRVYEYVKSAKKGKAHKVRAVGKGRMSRLRKA